MNLFFVVLVSLVVFAFSFYLLYTANLPLDKRYKQLWLPVGALIICLSMLQLDGWITRLYEQFFNEKMPFLLPHIQLMLNLTILITILCGKWCWKFVGSLTLKSPRKRLEKAITIFYPKELSERLKTKLFDPGSVSLVYYRSRGLIYLKKEWTYFSSFFKMAAIVPFILFMLLMIANVYTLSFIEYLPKYPIISLILLMEIAWFLNGQKSKYSKGSIDGKIATNSSLATYEELFKQYKELWEDRLLANGIIKENEYFHHRTNHFSYENISLVREHQLIINGICEKLKKKNILLDESYTKIMSEIIQERDVMIEDVIYDEFSSYFFPALYHLLGKNKKILIITHSQRAVQEAVDWVTKGIREVSGLEQVWKVGTYIEGLEQNTNCDVVIVSPANLKERRFLQYLRQLEKTNILEGIVLLHAEKLIANFSTILHAFNLNITELIGKKPQYIILTKWYEGIEQTVRSVLQCEPIDFNASSNISRNLHYMVWSIEGQKWFQHTLLPNVSHRQLDTEVVLSLPALKANIEPVHFINQFKTNVKESIQEIMDLKRALFNLGFDLKTLDQLPKMIRIHDKKLSIPIDDFTFFLIRDQNYNLIDCLNLWKGTGKLASFVHIVCPPYLLRDYLANQLDFFMSANRTIAPLAPSLSQSIWSIAYYLVERLSHSYILEEEVESYLRKAKISSYRSVVEGVHELFSKAFGPRLAYRLNIESEELVTFDRPSKDFIKKTQYRIPYSAKEKILPEGFRFMEIRHNTNYISEIFEGHIYQQYLPGQSHSFNGEPYKIEKVDFEHGVLEISFEPILEKNFYRHIEEYKIGQMIEERCYDNKNISIKQFEISIGTSYTDMKINTSGFVELNQLLNLKSMKVHLFHPEEQISRHYENGHLLHLEICSKMGEIENAAQIEFTLAFLLNELFVSLFPDTHHFVKACAGVDESFFDQTDSQSNNLKLITPLLQIENKPDGEGKVTLYIIEDSPISLGILESIRNHWEKIFDILNDYLFWLLNESNGKSDYLHFGYDQFPKELALSETFTLIDEILIKKKLREVRTKYQGNIGESDIISIGGHEAPCMFCGRKFPVAQIHLLDDGRKRCLTCKESAIEHVLQIEPLYKKVRQFFIDEYLVPLPADIELQMLSTAEIHKMSGLSFIPEAGHPRLSGKASMDQDGNLKVLIENGSPRVHTLSTLAHELTHIWQYENLDVKKMHLEELEGFASWVEVHFMNQLGEIPYANMLRQHLETRQDKYGVGYRLMIEKLSKLHDNATPFELYILEKVGL